MLRGFAGVIAGPGEEASDDAPREVVPPSLGLRPFRLRAEGTNARIPPKAEALLAGNSTETLDAHVIQPYYAGLLARAAGLAVSIAPEGEAIVLSATP